MNGPFQRHDCNHIKPPAQPGSIPLLRQPPACSRFNPLLSCAGNAIQSCLNVRPRFNLDKYDQISFAGDQVNFSNWRFVPTFQDAKSEQSQILSGDPFGTSAFAVSTLSFGVCATTVIPWHRQALLRFALPFPQFTCCLILPLRHVRPKLLVVLYLSLLLQNQSLFV